MNKLVNATSAVAGIILLMLVCYFWFWLYQSPQFAFGVVKEVLPTRSEYSLVILQQYAESAVAIESSVVSQLTPGNWVLLHGAQQDTTQPILFGETVIQLPGVNISQLTTPIGIVEAISQHKLPAVALGLLLLFMAGRLLKVVYFVVLSTLLLFTLWHGLFVANTLGYIIVGPSEQAMFYLAVVLYAAMTAFSPVHNQQWPSRLIAALLALALGELILVYFGGYSSLSLLLFVIASAWLPMVFTAVFAAFLLANALSATLLGAYGALLLCLFISLSRLRFAVERHVVRHLPPNVSRNYVKLKRSLTPQMLKATTLSGKVSLVDALKNRGVL